MKKETRTKGNVIVENIKVGDIHYEFGFGMCIRSEVITLPVKDEKGDYTWKSRNLSNGVIIDYMVASEYPHYSVNLYDYEAYMGCKFI